MKSWTATLVALTLIPALSGETTAFAADAARQINVRLGYFDLERMKTAIPELEGSYLMEVHTQQDLRADYAEGVKLLQSMRAHGSTQEEIDKAQYDLDKNALAKQAALNQLVRSQRKGALEVLSSAVSQVAKDKNLDVVVDADSVIGNKSILSKYGVDITEPVIRVLKLRDK